MADIQTNLFINNEVSLYKNSKTLADVSDSMFPPPAERH